MYDEYCRVFFNFFFFNCFFKHRVISYLVDTRNGAWEYSLEVAIASFEPFRRPRLYDL